MHRKCSWRDGQMWADRPGVVKKTRLIYGCSKGRSAARSAPDGRTCRERRRYGEGFDLQFSGGSGAAAGLLKNVAG